MWRSLRLKAITKSKVSMKPLRHRQYSSSAPSSGGGKVLFGIIASTGLGFAGAIAYGSYDPKFKSLLEKIPYVTNIYKMLPDNSSVTQKDDLNERKGKELSPILKKKLDREKTSIIDVPKPPIEPKPKSSGSERIFAPAVKKDFVSSENALNEALEKLKKSYEDTLNIHSTAADAVKFHTEKLYQALDISESKNDLVWKEANDARSEKEKTLRLAKQRAAETKNLIEKVKIDAKKLLDQDPNNPLAKNVDVTSEYLEGIQRAELKVAAAEKEAKTAAEYEQLVQTNKEQFKKELQVVLPNYTHDNKDRTVTQEDLNVLIAHAHRRIEQLQKQIAKQQVTEKIRVDEAIRKERLQDEELMDSKIQAEMQKRNIDLEAAVESRVASLKTKFEADLHKQLLRQAAAHADHLQEVLKVQEQELERKHVLELEEKLLHQKGIFISQTSGNMARLKGITEYLKAKSEFDESAKKAQALWLACVALNSKITSDESGNVGPLAKDIAALKIAADRNEDNDFIDSIVSSIPTEAINRGVFTNENLKQRFEKVKTVCKKVALVDENNDSLYRYFLSYLQSFLIIDTTSIPKAEVEGKVAVDSSEWDTFDILSRISYSLKADDFTQALRYANQLKGEPRNIAKDWMKEVQLLLETQLAIKALLAHAAAVGVQAYH